MCKKFISVRFDASWEHFFFLKVNLICRIKFYLFMTMWNHKSLKVFKFFNFLLIRVEIIKWGDLNKIVKSL